MGRKPLPVAQRKKQFNIFMDDELRRRLEAIADEHGRTIADEIRARLEYSLGVDEIYDAQTRALAEVIADFAFCVARNGTNHVAWHQHPKALTALFAAIKAYLEEYELPQADPDAFGPDDPETLGRSIARTVTSPFFNKRQYDHVGKIVREAIEGTNRNRLLMEHRVKATKTRKPKKQ